MRQTHANADGFMEKEWQCPVKAGNLSHPGCQARTAGLPGTHAGAPCRNAGWQFSGRERMEVGWQYYQPTCVTVTELRSPFIYRASRAVPCYSRQCDFSRRRDRQETKSGIGHLPRHALSGVSITPEKCTSKRNTLKPSKTNGSIPSNPVRLKVHKTHRTRKRNNIRGIILERMVTSHEQTKQAGNRIPDSG